MLPEEKRQVYRFGDFELDYSHRLLLRDGRPVALNPKAFDLLVALLENRGQLMTKEQLLERVWPNQFVEEGNLTVHMSTVRKALGERREDHRYVVTIPGQGYRFVANVEPSESFLIEEHTISRIRIEEGGDSATTNEIKSIAATSSVRLQVARSSRLWIGLAAVILFAGLVTASILGARRFFQARGSSSRGANMIARKLTSNGNVGRAALSRDGKYFAYEMFDNGKYTLWAQNVNGGNSVQLLPPDDKAVGGVGFTPDGSRVFYQSNESLFQIPILGGLSQKVLDRIPVNFSISPDGSRVAFVRVEHNQSKLMVANLDGTGERELAGRPAGQGFSATGPGWSPDGSMLAIGVGDGPANPNHTMLMAVRVADGNLQQLSAQTWDEINKVAWLRDGRGIIFHARGAESDYHVWLLDYPQGGLHLITNDLNRYGKETVSVSDDGNSLLTVRGEGFCSIWLGPSNDFTQLRQVIRQSDATGLSWTPDGKVIYVTTIGNNSSLWIVNPDGSGARQITNSGYLDMYPKATADGRSVIFQSNRGGGLDIWRINLDGSNLTRLTNGGRSSTPGVTPDGKWIVFTYQDEQGLISIWKAGTDGTAPAPLTKQESSWPRISPDGKMVACSYLDKSVPAKSQLAVLSIADGRLLYLFDLPGSGTMRGGAHWSPDGAALNYRDISAGLWRQPLSGGPPEKLSGIPNKRWSFFEWSNDGQQFAISSDDQLRDVVLLSNFR